MKPVFHQLFNFLSLQMVKLHGVDFPGFSGFRSALTEILNGLN